MLATVAVLASCGNRRADLAVDPHPATGAPGDQRLHAWSAGAAWDRTSTATCLNPTDCDSPKAMGELAVTSRNPVQLSVPSAISHAPWVLLRAYEGPDNTVVEMFPRDTTRAVTIPTVDPRRGRLTGIAVRTADAGARRAGKRVPACRTPSGRSAPCGPNRRSAPRVRARLRGSGPAVCRRQTACRPTPPGHAASASWTGRVPSGRCASG